MIKIACQRGHRATTISVPKYEYASFKPDRLHLLRHKFSIEIQN